MAHCGKVNADSMPGVNAVGISAIDGGVAFGQNVPVIMSDAISAREGVVETTRSADTSLIR